MSVFIVIPARFASTRLPEKMLLSLTGKPLIQHTYEQASQSKLATSVIIATDDERIENTAKKFGANVIMTSPKHANGTERLGEVATKHLSTAKLIINVQGDEPEINPNDIDTLIRLSQASNAKMGTLVSPFSDKVTDGIGSPHDPNCVKALLGEPILDPHSKKVLGYQALYFSRALIPYPRDSQGQTKKPSDYFLHLGIYSYQPDFLTLYARLPPGKLEQIEKLEHLRALENGFNIVAGIVEKATPGIDSLSDYQQFVERYSRKTHDVCIGS